MSNMTTTRERNRAVLAAVRRRLEQEPENVLPTLQLLADPDSPTAAVDESTVSLAKTLNAHRVVSRLRELRARSYDTAQVAEMLGGVTRQAVSARVAKGRLMSIEISRRSYFPDWQFAGDRPVGGLSRVLECLTQCGYDTFAADALMRTPLAEAGGRSAADLLAAGELDDALHYIRIAGGGF